MVVEHPDLLESLLALAGLACVVRPKGMRSFTNVEGQGNSWEYEGFLFLSGSGQLVFFGRPLSKS